MLSITANDLKRNGIAGVERALFNSDEHSVMIDVRGKVKYIILSVEEFNQFREYQLDQAIAEAEQCVNSGEYSTVTDFDDYLTSLTKEIANGA